MTEIVEALKVVKNGDALKTWRASLLSASPEVRIALVPTMGALHNGHLSLIRAAKAAADKVVVSIFVNPLQFGPNEDFGKYPRSFEKDLELCRKEGVDLIFHPDTDEIYPHGLESVTQVIPPQGLTSRLCGAFRPGHFTGVATVVTMLFNLVRPSMAFFGEKDYQQLAVIRTVVKDLTIDIEIKGVPTAREKDGLAMSSRNLLLNEHQRALAPELHRTLQGVAGEVRLKKNPLAEVLSSATAALESMPGIAVQYLECCDPHTLQSLSAPQPEMVILIAAKIGPVRLIDNLIVRK